MIRPSSFTLSLLLASHAAADDLLLAVIQGDGLPTGVNLLDPQTGQVLGVFIDTNWPDNGELGSTTALAAGPKNTFLVAQPGGDGKIGQYSNEGVFLGVYLGNTSDPNPVDNIRSMAVTLGGAHLITSDWDDTNDIHRFNHADGSVAGLDNDPLGTLIFGSNPPVLDQPQAIEILDNGELLVADIRQRKLLRFDPHTGAELGEFSSFQITASVPDIDQLPDGNVLIAEDGSADRITVFDPDGNIITQFDFRDPNGVHALADGTFLVTSASTFDQGKGLFHVASDGTILATIDDSRSYGPLELIPLGATCRADIDGNGTIDSNDFFAFLDLFATGDPDADLTGDGAIDSADFFAFLDCFVAGG